MSVATLIVVRPAIEVKAVKGNSLRPDRDCRQERTHFAIEAILVHAEIRRGIAQANKARQEEGEYAAMARFFG
jgi:hypothetical protein